MARERYSAGRWLYGELVTVRCVGDVVEIYHDGQLIKAHSRKHSKQKEEMMHRRRRKPYAQKRKVGWSPADPFPLASRAGQAQVDILEGEDPRKTASFFGNRWADCSLRPGESPARNLSIVAPSDSFQPSFLIHNRDRKFSSAFNEVFQDQGTRIRRTPLRAPTANAFAERWVLTAD